MRYEYVCSCICEWKIPSVFLFLLLFSVPHERNSQSVSLSSCLSTHLSFLYSILQRSKCSWRELCDGDGWIHGFLKSKTLNCGGGKKLQNGCVGWTAESTKIEFFKYLKVSIYNSLYFICIIYPVYLREYLRWISQSIDIIRHRWQALTQLSISAALGIVLFARETLGLGLICEVSTFLFRDNSANHEESVSRWYRQKVHREHTSEWYSLQSEMRNTIFI